MNVAELVNALQMQEGPVVFESPETGVTYSVDEVDVGTRWNSGNPYAYTRLRHKGDDDEHS